MEYTPYLLHEINMIGLKPAYFLIQQQHRLSLIKSEEIKDPRQYRQLVGKLIYVTITRLNVTYMVNLFSQFMKAPCITHYNVVVQVLHYLKQTPG